MCTLSPLLTASYAVTAGLAHSFHLEGGNCTLMSLSLGVLHTRLIPISFGYPYVSRQLVALACAQRRGEPGLLSLVDARLSRAVPPAPRADPPFSPLPDSSGLDADLPGRSDRARRHRHLRHRADPPHARGPQPAAARPQRPRQSSLDCRGHTLSAAQSVGVDRGVGVCHRQGRGEHLSVANGASLSRPSTF